MAIVRNITSDDLFSLKQIIESTGLFPADLLDDMTYDYFHNAESTDIWLTLEENQQPVAIAYCAPERLTDGTYNLYLIAVLNHLQGKGFGAMLMNYIENHLRERGHRILIVETSGLPEFDLTRKFYLNLGYHREAVIRDFYREGEDKIVFWKKLSVS